MTTDAKITIVHSLQGLFFSCSGNGNGRSWNNRGSNGNYWSSTWNSARNARNLNFNSGGVNPQNNNNRYNGFSLRPVQHLSIFLLMNIQPTDQLAAGCYHLTRSQLLYDLYVAFYDAARHKHKMAYVQKFEANLAENLNELCDDLLTRRYKALPSKCFIVLTLRSARCFARHSVTASYITFISATPTRYLSAPSLPTHTAASKDVALITVSAESVSISARHRSTGRNLPTP